jgi:hypothetical protein
MIAGTTKRRALGGTWSWRLRVSINAPRSTAERWCDITTPRAASTKATQLQSAPSSSKEAPLGVAIQDAEEGIKAGKKRHEQRHQEATTDDDGNINEQAGGASVEHIAEAAGNNKRQARPPTDHYEKLLEESCPNHTYVVKHKLRDYSLMKSFMATASLPPGHGGR